MKGVPLRINLGPRDIEKGMVEFVRRDTREKSQQARAAVVETSKEILGLIQKNLYDRAKVLLNEKISKPADYAEFKSIIEGKGGFVAAGWCGMLECEEKIKVETGADIRVIPFDQAGRPEACILCGNPSQKVAMFARAY
jgi:prolyl-tRNA synthetase